MKKGAVTLALYNRFLQRSEPLEPFGSQGLGLCHGISGNAYAFLSALPAWWVPDL